MSLARTIYEMTPNTPFAALLLSDFGVEVPAAAPKYQAEYLYKYCLSMKQNGVPEDIVVSAAAEKVEEFVVKFPWCKTKYEDMKMSEVKERKPSKLFKDVTDGSIVYNEELKKFEGFLNKKVVSRAVTVEKVQKWMKTKYSVDAVLA